MATTTDRDRAVEREPRGRVSGRVGLAALIATLLLGLLAVGLVIYLAVFREDSTDPGYDGTDPSVPATGITTSEIIDHPEQYLGRTVTVAGEVDRVLGRWAFTIGGGDFIGDDRLLILSTVKLPQVPRRPADNPLLEDDIVQVTGPVRRFDLAAAERELGVDLDDGLFDDHIGRLAIVARSLALTPRETSPDVRAAPVSVAELTGDSRQYRNRIVTVSGRVTAIVGLQGFLLGDELLVVHDESLPSARTPWAGEIVQVTGQFYPFDLARVERETGVDLPDERYAAFAGRPALIAVAIRQVE